MRQTAAAKDHQGPSHNGRAAAGSRRRSGHPLMGMHDALGNRGMQRLSAMQTPPVSVAARVPPGAIQRTCACNGSEPCGCDTGAALPWIQRKANDAGAVPSRSLAATALSGQGAGRPLDTASRAFMEPRFGRDLGGVRIHTDAAAARSARMLHAHAFTVGNDVYFAEGRYDPATLSGRTLLAHELTHTLQQGGGTGGPVALSAAGVSHPQDASEREATHVAQDIVAGSAVAHEISSTGPAVQREEEGTSLWDDITAGAEAIEEAVVGGIQNAAPVSATTTVASSSSAATTLSADSGAPKDQKGKRGRRSPCMSEAALCGYQNLLISKGLPESAQIYFARMVTTHGGSTSLYCRSGDQYIDAKTFSIIMAQQGEWGIVQACSKDNELLGFAAGSKNYGDRQHAEMKALEMLEIQLAAIPLEERTGGALTSACIKIACDQCRPALKVFADTNLPGGPAPVDLACGNPEFGIRELAYFAYLHVFEQNCESTPPSRDKKPKDKEPEEEGSPGDTLPEQLLELGESLAKMLAADALLDVALAIAGTMAAIVTSPLVALAALVLGIMYFWDQLKLLGSKIAKLAEWVWGKFTWILGEIGSLAIKLGELISWVAGKIAWLAQKLAAGIKWAAGKAVAGVKWLGGKIASGAEAVWDWLFGSDPEPVAPIIDIPVTEDPTHCATVAHEDTIVKMSADLLFPFNEWKLKTEADDPLKEAAAKIGLMLQKDDRIMIEGYTDNIGTDEYNQHLSEQRAGAVASWFVAHNVVPMSRIQIEGYGKTRAQYNDPEGRKKDRRVEIWVPKHGSVEKVCW